MICVTVWNHMNRFLRTTLQLQLFMFGFCTLSTNCETSLKTLVLDLWRILCRVSKAGRVNQNLWRKKHVIWSPKWSHWLTFSWQFTPSFVVWWFHQVSVADYKVIEIQGEIPLEIQRYRRHPVIVATCESTIEFYSNNPQKYDATKSKS